MFALPPLLFGPVRTSLLTQNQPPFYTAKNFQVLSRWPAWQPVRQRRRQAIRIFLFIKYYEVIRKVIWTLHVLYTHSFHFLFFHRFGRWTNIVRLSIFRLFVIAICFIFRVINCVHVFSFNQGKNKVKKKIAIQILLLKDYSYIYSISILIKQLIELF